MRRGLLLAAAVVLAWSRVLGAPFTYDDRIEVVGNRTLRSLGEWSAIAGYHPNRPLLIGTYALNWAWGGLDPTGYHVVSLAIHVLNALLAWRLALRLLSPDRAFLAAALWALHPMTTEAVTYITGRSDGLSGTFWLLALVGWIDHRRGRRGPALAWGAALAALLTKEMAVCLPLVFLATSRFLLDDRPPWRAWAPPVVAVAVAAGVRVMAWGWPVAEVPRGAWAQLCSQAESWWIYLRLWLLPWGQSILHDRPGEASVFGAGALLVALTAAAWLLRRGGLGAWALVLAVAYVGPASLIPLKEVMAEHRSYLAGYGLMVAIAAVLPLRPAVWLLPLALGSLTVVRNEAWRDEVRLWKGATDANPASADAWYGYGDALRFAQRFDEAGTAFRRVLELRPKDDDALVNLGITLVERGREADARGTWERALKANPRNCAAHNNLAGLDLRAGRLPVAAQGYASTLYWCPQDPIALRTLGGIYERMGDYRRAADTLRRYLEAAPPGPERDDATAQLKRLEP